MQDSDPENPPPGPSPGRPLSRERRAELLVIAAAGELIGLAGECLAGGPDRVVLVPPEVGERIAEVAA